ncbi:MAG: CvpA family protein [Clostridia bacterium]|nr:CvpA family protein [Clostridia bacterium]
MSLSSIDWLSAVLLFILASDFVVGFSRGLVRQAAGLIGAVLAVLAGARFYRAVGTVLLAWFPKLRQPAPDVLGFLGVFVAIMIIVDLIGHGLSTVMKAPGLSALNGLGGAALRVARGCLLISIVLVVAVSVGLPDVNRTIERSPLAVQLLRFAPAVWGELERFIPPDLTIPGLGGTKGFDIKPGNRSVL